MSKQTTLEAVKRAMRTAGKANLALTVGKAIEALEDEELEMIKEDAVAIEALANAIIHRAQTATRQKTEGQQKNSYLKGWKNNERLE